MHLGQLQIGRSCSVSVVPVAVVAAIAVGVRCPISSVPSSNKRSHVLSTIHLFPRRSNRRTDASRGLVQTLLRLGTAMVRLKVCIRVRSEHLESVFGLGSLS